MYRSFFSIAFTPGSIYWLFPLAGGLITVMVSFFVSYVSSGQLIGLDTFPLFFLHGWLIALQMTLYLFIVHFSIRYFNAWCQSQPDKWLRYALEICFILLVGFFITKMISLVKTQPVFIFNPTQAASENTNQLQNITLSLLLVIYAFFTSFRVLRHLQQKQAEVASWQKEIIQSQFEALKDQLNPHFLFNSLSVLTALVYKDAYQAEAFIDKLSKTYRYLLDNRDKHTVELENELQFLSHYQFLLSYRFGPKLHIELQTSADNKSLFLPPHTIMILLEHIISRSKMSVATPLIIHLSIEQQHLIVSHTLQDRPALAQEPNNRIHILQERYDALGKDAALQSYVEKNRQYYSIPLFATFYA